MPAGSRSIASAASLVVDPPIEWNEVQTRSVSRGPARIEAAEAMHDPIKRPLVTLRVRDAKEINEVVVCHEESALLDGVLESGPFHREEFHVRRKVVPRHVLSGRGRFVIDEERAVSDSFRRPVQPPWLVLDHVEIRIEKTTFSVEDETEIIIVTVPD